MPLDIKVEAFSGMIFGIIVCIFKYSSGFGRIKLSNVMTQKNKTYEGTSNLNKAYAMRNLQRGRSGAIFSSAKSFPDAHKVLRENSKLNSIVGKQF